MYSSIVIPDYGKSAKFKVAKTIDPYLKQFLPEQEPEAAPVPGKDTMIFVQSKRGLKPEEDIRWSTTLYEVRLVAFLHQKPLLLALTPFPFRLFDRSPTFRASLLSRSLPERGAPSLE